MKRLFFILFLFLLVPVITADNGIQIVKTTLLTSNYYNVSGVTSDILNFTYLFRSDNDTYITTSNTTYDGCVNNNTYITTSNSSTEGRINNLNNTKVSQNGTWYSIFSSLITKITSEIANSTYLFRSDNLSYLNLTSLNNVAFTNNTQTFTGNNTFNESVMLNKNLNMSKGSNITMAGNINCKSLAGEESWTIKTAANGQLNFFLNGTLNRFRIGANDFVSINNFTIGLTGNVYSIDTTNGFVVPLNTAPVFTPVGYPLAGLRFKTGAGRYEWADTLGNVVMTTYLSGTIYLKPQSVTIGGACTIGEHASNLTGNLCSCINSVWRCSNSL